MKARIKGSYINILLSKLPYIICFIFFVLFSILSIVRHNHFQSYGFDLGINDQVVWQYSNLHLPITTIDHIIFNSKLNVHIELVYALIAPFYWIWSDARMLILLQAAFFCSSGIAIYLLSKKYKLNYLLCISILISYFIFYGTQNALWFDVHSASFEAAFTAWFIYFLVSQKHKLSILFFVLAITGKENVAGITFLISLVYFITARKKSGIYFAVASLTYLAFVFGIYFPSFVKGGYRFEHTGGLFSHLDITLLLNTLDKLKVYFYSLFSFGFIPLLNPIYLIPVFGNLASYFILGSNVSTAQDLFLQYRIELVPLMAWATIATVAKYKLLNSKKIAIYVLICALITQYVLHLPLSYLTKQWFWQENPSIENINRIIKFIPRNASLVAQNNITPHVSQRAEIFTLWPENKTLPVSVCGASSCNWFRWPNNAKYLVVDTSTEWETRHMLENRDNFIKGLNNLEKAKVIDLYKEIGSARLYKIIKNPSEFTR